MTKQIKRLFEIKSVYEIRKFLDRNNPDSPLSKFIGNDSAIDILSDIAYSALLTEDHSCAGRVLVTGQPSVGKTTFAKLFAEILQLPFLYFSAEEISSIDYLFNAVEKKLEEEFLYLAILGEKAGKELYELPPLFIMIDEAHCLNPVIRNNLLSALEAKTSLLITHTAEIDCKNVFWLIATTDRGKLPTPLESRFIPVNLFPYTVPEVAKIVQLNTGWAENVCSFIAKYTKIPRDALAFSKQVELSSKRSNISLMEAVQLTAKRRGIDENGIDKKQIICMISLYRNEKGLSAKTLCGTIGVNMEELENYIMPLLLINNFVSISNRHFISKTGSEYLRRKRLI